MNRGAWGTPRPATDREASSLENDIPYAPPLKKRNLSTKANCVSLRPFGVFRGFSGFLSLKTGFRAATQLFRSPIFLFSEQKKRVSFRRSLHQQRTPKRINRVGLEPFLRFLALQRTPKKVREEGFEPPKARSEAIFRKMRNGENSGSNPSTGELVYEMTFTYL